MSMNRFRLLLVISLVFSADVATSTAQTTQNGTNPTIQVKANQMGGAIQTNLSSTLQVVSTFAGSSAGATGGIGTAAKFNAPYGITTDGTNLYVADNRNKIIRKVAIATGVVTTLAGTAGRAGNTDGTGAAARFSNPFAITTDGVNLYVIDYFTVRKINIATGIVTTLAGSPGASGAADGMGASARFAGLKGITTDGVDLFVTDNTNFTIRRIAIATGDVTTLAGSVGNGGSADGIGSDAKFYSMNGITTDGTNLFVADMETIRKVDIATGDVTTLAGTAGNKGATDGIGSAAKFGGLAGITMDGTNLYVADSGNNIIRKMLIATGAVTTLAGTASVSGSADGIGPAASFNDPYGITTDGTSIFVTDIVNARIRQIN